MSEYDFTKATFYKTDNIHVYLQKFDEYFYVHLDVNEWKPSVIRTLREKFLELKKLFQQFEVDLLFTTTNNPKIVRLLPLIHPVRTVQPVPGQPGMYVGAWDMEG